MPEIQDLNGFIRQTETVADAYSLTLADVLGADEEVTAAKTLSVGSGKKTKEILNYLLKIRNPRERMTGTPINIPGGGSQIRVDDGC
jgi:hypothetical protein